MAKFKLFFSISTLLGVLFLLEGCTAGMLSPKGAIAAAEKHLFFDAVFLMLIVVVPVIFLTLFISHRYRESNLDATYSPEWSHSTLLEAIWWGIPCVIIAILATITWVTSHTLDPYRPLQVEQKPLTIQVVALDWRWLFIYPEQHVASLNYVKFPVHVPIQFLITADAPMNGFQIPQLAGQIYAMAGMQTKLNILPNVIGNYDGMSTNISGNGFSGMRFIANVSSQEDFDTWVKTVSSQTSQALNWDSYRELAKPSENHDVITFGTVEDDLFNQIIMSYMMPGMENAETYAIKNNLPSYAVPTTP